MGTDQLEHACCLGLGNCRSHENCQRRSVVERVLDQTRRWNKLHIKDADTATVADIDASALSRLRSGQIAVGLRRLLEAEKRLKSAIPARLIELLSVAIGDREGNLKEAAAAAVSPLDDCAIGEVTDAQRAEAAGAIYWNVLLGLVGGSPSARRKLPSGMEGTYAQFGDQSLGLAIIQTEPPLMDATLDERIAHQKVVVHEIKHAHTRAQDELRMLVSQKKTASSGPSRKKNYGLS